MTNRQRILEAVMARLQTIQVDAGYITDAGRRIYLGEVVDLGPDDPDDALAVVPLDTQVLPNRIEVLPVEVQAVAKADLEQPHVAIEQLLADIARAFETADRTLGGLVKYMELGPTRALPREAGSTTVGCGITYSLTYARVWGQP